MHMADALLSPAVGGTMWAASAVAVAYSSRESRNSDDRKVPLMGVMGAFLFAAQLVNFSIPGTGSSGHLGGGLLLAIILGPTEAFLTIASVLVMQALLFADGGLLALGCNIFNLGFIPAFVVFPFFYKRLIGRRPRGLRQSLVTVFSAVLALQLGSLAVVAETFCSGISSLPFSSFVLLMQPIHLAIGLVEGVATLAIVNFVAKARPEIVQSGLDVRKQRTVTKLMPLLVCALVVAGGLSLFASKDPDGLEWAVGRVAGKGGLQAPAYGPHRAFASLQEKSAFFPDYGFKRAVGMAASGSASAKGGTEVGDSVARIVGTVLTLILVFAVGFVLQKRRQPSPLSLSDGGSGEGGS